MSDDDWGGDPLYGAGVIVLLLGAGLFIVGGLVGAAIAWWLS